MRRYRSLLLRGAAVTAAVLLVPTAAIDAAGVLGVTEQYSSGLGGGGFLAYYDAKTKQVSTIDGRETAPAAYRKDTLTEGGVPIPFLDVVTSGLSNGVPGTPATWAKAPRQWGTWSLGEALAPGAQLARRGFVVDHTFQDQTAQNVERFDAFPATRRLFLSGGHLPVVGSRLTNPDLARTYAEIGRQGVGTATAARSAPTS